MAPAIWKAVAFLVQAAKRLSEAVVQTATSVEVSGFADRRWVDVRRHNNLHTLNLQIGRNQLSIKICIQLCVWCRAPQQQPLCSLNWSCTHDDCGLYM